MTTTSPLTVTSTSKQFWLNAADFLRALIVAALSAPVTAVLTSLSAGHFSISWPDTWHLAIVSGSAYLLKNFLTASRTTVTGVPVGVSTTVTIPPPGTSVQGPPVDANSK